MKFSNIFTFLKYLPFVDDIVSVVHDISDKDSSADKAVDVVEDLVGAAVKYFGTANPALAAELTGVLALLQPVLDRVSGENQPAPAPPAA